MENKVIEFVDFEIVCRICLDKKEKMSSMFENSLLPNLVKTYREMLEECASVHIFTDDLLPKNICLECMNYLEQCYKFKIKYLSVEKLLKQIISNVSKIEYASNNSNDFIKDDDCFNSSSNEKISENKSISELISEKHESIKESKLELHDDNNTEDTKNIEKYNCAECGINFQLKIEFYKHQKRVHRKAYKCIFCAKNFIHAKSLWTHSPETIRCKICKQNYGCKTKIKRHIETAHSTCDICDKIFQNSAQCKVHRTIHEDKRHLCTYCGKTFADKRSHRIHVRRHTGEKSYQCIQCDAKFCDAGGLRMHSVKHSDEKKHECDICKKSFKTKNSVIRHKRSHTEENNYPCDICNKQFKTHDYLRDHKKIHTGAFNHICTYCNKGFYKSHKLKIHLLSHTGEKPFTCGKCGKSYNQKFLLSNHMKTHEIV